MKNLKKKVGHVQLVIMIKEKLFAFQNLSFGMKKIWDIMLILQLTVSSLQEILFHFDFMM